MIRRSYSLPRFLPLPDVVLEPGQTRAYSADTAMPPQPVTAIERLVLAPLTPPGVVTLTVGNLLVLDGVPTWAVERLDPPLLIGGMLGPQRAALRVEAEASDVARVYRAGLWVRVEAEAY